MSLTRTLGANIRTLRVYKGVTQAELAKRAGISRNSMGNIERGEQEPRHEVLERLGAALNIEPGKLYDSKLVIIGNAA